MTTQEKEIFVFGLEEELLKGGVIFSEWATRISQEATGSFVAGFYLATLVTAVAAIETQLRAEYGTGIKRFHELIDGSDLSENLKSEIHLLRRYRNRWVHVSDPWDDNRINTRWTCFNKVHQSW